MRKTKLMPVTDIVSDMAILLDAAGIVAINNRHLENMAHVYDPQQLLDFACSLSRNSGRRVPYSEFANSFIEEMTDDCP